MNLRAILAAAATVPLPGAIRNASSQVESAAQQAEFDRALACLCLEDPSITVTSDRTTGQQLMGGMGELHLEVATSRLKSEYKLDVRTGPVRVAYRESVTDEVERTSAHVAVLGEKAPKSPITAEDEGAIRVTMRVAPVDTGRADGGAVTRSGAGGAGGGGHAPPLRIEPDARRGLGPKEIRAVREGVAAASAYGELLGYPLHGVRATILELRRPRGAGIDALRSAAAAALSEAVAAATPRLLEPLMRLEARAIPSPSYRDPIAVPSPLHRHHTARLPPRCARQSATWARCSPT